MTWGVRWYLVGSALLGVLGALTGCSGGNWFAEREPWRHEAEVQCINAGNVKEGAGIVRINAIRGPGVCGADFPLRVSALGESTLLGYSDDPRPPGVIPGGARSPRWPINPDEAPASRQEPPPPPPSRSRVLPEYQVRGVATDEPVSIIPPGAIEQAGAQSETYDFRRPFGASPPVPARKSRAPRDPYTSSPRDDLSPEPYERRPLVDAPATGTLRGAPSGVIRAPLRELPADAPRASMRDALPPDVERRRELPPLGPARAQVTGAISPVAVSPAATLACPMVSELERWIATAVQPAAMRWLGSPVAEITQISAYSCRGMNGNPRARISEHAFGNALDISAFTLADGRRITVKGGWNGLPEEQGFLRDIQGAACDQFTTVLAPGSNVYHYDHMHVDLMRRASGHRACNPRAVSGEEVAARAGARYAGRGATSAGAEAAINRRGAEPNATGSLAPRRPPPKRLRYDPDEDHRFPALPMAEPGDDGEDD